MDLSKGLKYVALGFLFTLIRFTLTINGVAVDVMPDAVGWIFFFLAFDKLGDYVSDAKYLKWISLGLTFVTAGMWLTELFRPGLDLDIVKTAVTVISAVYMFILFGALEKIAKDYNSKKDSIIMMLRYLNPGLLALFVIVGVYAAKTQNVKAAGAAAVFGAAALAAAIVTAFVLFRLQKEISEKL